MTRAETPHAAADGVVLDRDGGSEQVGQDRQTVGSGCHGVVGEQAAVVADQPADVVDARPCGVDGGHGQVSVVERGAEDEPVAGIEVADGADDLRGGADVHSDDACVAHADAEAGAGDVAGTDRDGEAGR